MKKLLKKITPFAVWCLPSLILVATMLGFYFVDSQQKPALGLMLTVCCAVAMSTYLVTATVIYGGNGKIADKLGL